MGIYDRSNWQSELRTCCAVRTWRVLMESIWVTETNIRKREPLSGDLQTEAAVIGAGMAGVLTAYYLQQAGIKTVVVEADRIGSGQTKNTTAKITFQHGLLYDRLIHTLGSRGAFCLLLCK